MRNITLLVDDNRQGHLRKINISLTDSEYNELLEKMVKGQKPEVTLKGRDTYTTITLNPVKFKSIDNDSKEFPTFPSCLGNE